MMKPDVVYGDLKLAIQREFERLEREWSWRRGDKITMTLSVERKGASESNGIEVSRII